MAGLFVVGGPCYRSLMSKVLSPNDIDISKSDLSADDVIIVEGIPLRRLTPGKDNIARYGVDWNDVIAAVRADQTCDSN